MSSIWDKITGKDEPHPDPPQPPVPTATETSTQHVPPKPQEDDHSFSFSKFKDALTGDGSPKGNAPELPPPVASTEARDKDGKDDWHDKFRDLLDLGASNRSEAEEERLRLERAAAEADVAAKQAEEKAHFKGKLKGLFQSDEEEAAERERLIQEAIQKRREAEELRRKEHSISSKIKDVFDRDDEEKEKERQRLAEEAKKNESFGARVRNIFDRSPTPPPPKKDWKDKLNELAGGGARGEAKEDKIDKTVDFFQEHVLREGQQKNESAFEQAKDSQIADAIRGGLEKVTGHDFSKDKD